MMRKLYFMLMLLGFAGLSANAQDIKQKIDKAIKDPKAKENAAKADVYVVKKERKIIDTTKIASNNSETQLKKRKRNFSENN